MRRFDAITQVVSSNDFTSPITGLRAALIHIEVEGGGTAVYGDLLRLEADDGTRIDIVARRAELLFANLRPPPIPLASAPAEIIPLLGRGPLAVREHRVMRGDRVRLRATLDGSIAREPVILELQ
jgi:hypothetical protein